MPFIIPPRINRASFANQLIFNMIIVSAFFILGADYIIKALTITLNPPLLQNIFLCVIFIALLCFVVNVFRLYTSRLHDLNRSGFWQLLFFIPFVSIILSIIIFTAPGTKGENKFGNQPKPNSKLGCVFGVINAIIILLLIVIGSIASIASYT